MSRNRSNKRAYKTLQMITKPSHKKMMIIFDNNYKPLADNGLMRRWTEYCNELYNYPIKINEELIKDITISQIDTAISILESEVRNTINTLANGKDHVNINIPGELIKC